MKSILEFLVKLHIQKDNNTFDIDIDDLLNSTYQNPVIYKGIGIYPEPEEYFKLNKISAQKAIEILSDIFNFIKEDNPIENISLAYRAEILYIYFKNEYGSTIASIRYFFNDQILSYHKKMGRTQISKKKFIEIIE